MLWRRSRGSARASGSGRIAKGQIGCSCATGGCVAMPAAVSRTSRPRPVSTRTLRRSLRAARPGSVPDRPGLDPNRFRGGEAEQGRGQGQLGQDDAAVIGADQPGAPADQRPELRQGGGGQYQELHIAPRQCVTAGTGSVAASVAGPIIGRRSASEGAWRADSDAGPST